MLQRLLPLEGLNLYGSFGSVIATFIPGIRLKLCDFLTISIIIPKKFINLFNSILRSWQMNIIRRVYSHTFTFFNVFNQIVNASSMSESEGSSKSNVEVRCLPFQTLRFPFFIGKTEFIYVIN